MILNVLLVDDEYLVLKGLEMILTEQTEAPLKIVTAMDAADALEKLASFRPDVLLTDINMPEANGFELIEQVKQKVPLCRFIICSGYDEQAYLKQALHLHVADYFLKPIDKVLLIRRLKELAEEKEQMISHLLLKIQLLLVKGTTCPEDTFSSQDLDFLFPETAFCLCAVGGAQADFPMIRERLQRYFPIIYEFSLNSRILFLLNYSDKIQSVEVCSILSSILDLVCFGHSCFLSKKGKAAAIASISLHYQEALCEMVLLASSLSGGPHDTDLLQAAAARTLSPAVRVLTYEENVENYSMELYEELPENSAYALAFVEIFSAYLLISDITVPVDLIRQQSAALPSGTLSCKNLAHFVKKVLNSWYDSFSSTEQETCSSKVAAACRYMDQHYQEDLSLDELAEILAVNASYLSYIFKKETGSTVVQYLTSLRMEQACRLLKNRPDLTLEEIALQSGYNSTTYFHKIFRSRFGISPRQWQQMN